MIRDEFNTVEVTNEKQISGREFGKTQKTEYSFQHENKVPDGELNEKYVGKTVKKVTEVNVEYTNKVPNHGITVVKSTVTATNVAATTTSAIVVASTVAVTAIAVATGISVALHDYKFDVDSFLISSNEVSYRLTIVDNRNEDSEQYLSYNQRNLQPRRLAEESKEEDRPFLLRVYNNSYDSSKELYYGYNEGSFTSLTLGDTYNIVLTENRFGGETIFSESFTTYKSSHFRDVEIYTSGNFIIASIDYLDELEKYDGFVLNLTQADSETTYTLPLDLTTDAQEIDVKESLPNFDFSATYQYEFCYLEGQESVGVEKGNLTFDYVPASIVRGVIWDKTADFIKKEFYVTLDYQDDFNYFDRFELTLQDAEYPEEVNETFSLLSTTAPQKITIPEESSIYFRRAYYYMFTYYNKNTDMQEMIDSGEVTFTDISDGQKKFNGLSINEKPNYEEQCFYVALDYVDDYHEMVSFHLILKDVTGMEIYVYLDENTNNQAIKISDYGIDFTKSYEYSLVYYDMEISEEVVATEGTLTFDNSDAVSVFNNFIFDEKANFKDRSFVVQMDFRDDVGNFDKFEFILTDQDNGLVETYELAKTTEPQTLYCNETEFNEDSGEYEYTMDIIKDSFSYAFRHFDKAINDYVMGPQKEFRFDNSIVSEFLGIESSFDFTAETSGDSYVVPIKFNYDNEANSYTGFAVSIQRTGINVGELRFEGETLTEDWLYGVFVPASGYSIDDIIDVGGVEIVVTAYQDNVNYPNLDPYLEVYNKETRFTLEQVKEIHSLSIVSDGIHNGGEIMLSVVYSGPRDYINCKLILEAESGNKYTFNVMLNTINYSYVLLSETDDGNVIDDEDFNEDFINHPMKVSMSYSTFDTNGSSADGEWSDYITKVIYDSYQFSLSV